MATREYKRLADAVADAMFGSAFAGRPVYALPDPLTLRAVLEASGVANGGIDDLARIVRTSLYIDNAGVAPFRWQADAAREHSGQPLEVPPALPLLVLLTLVAEQMQADGDLAAHNYYSRLHRLLRVPTESYARVEGSYRQAADLLWGSLNSWLEAWEGERGVPTAYAVGGHAFVGLPMSQAVVRQHDRGGLHELFAMEGLTPGLRISPADMSAALDPYATTTPSPLSSHLSRVWRLPSARERIVDAACLELEAWDGSGIGATAASGRVVATRLLAFLRQFPRKSIELNLMFPYRSEGPDVARFDLPDGELTIPTIAGPSGSTRLAGVASVSAESLLSEQLDGELGDDDSRPFGRRPRRVTPLRWDDVQGGYVEVERISLGEDSVVLAFADARALVEGHLKTHARPGWAEVPGILPEGFLVYQHVQIISAPVGQVHFDLLPLAPRAQTSLTLRGGFVLPGLLRKWSALEPPEVVALAAGASTVDVRVYRGSRIDADALIVEKRWDGELVVLTLAGRGLSDGEYLVAMFADGAARATSTTLLRLRSASTPHFRVDDADIRLVYSPESSSQWPLSAGAANWPSFVNGARTQHLAPYSSRSKLPMREFVPRQRGQRPPARSGVRVGVPMDSESCLLTGKHRLRFPTVHPGRKAPRTIEGECETCGVIKRAAGTQWAAKKKDSTGAAKALPDIPPVVQSTGPDFEVAFDALNHVGAGSFGAFERIAAQTEGSGLFADALLRRLEVAGHIDVARDRFLHVTEWAVNSSTLLPIADGSWVLIGFRSNELLEKLRDRFAVNGTLISSIDAELARIAIVGTLPEQGLADLGVQVLSESTADAIASSLPRLTAIAQSLKRTAVSAYRSAEFWDTASASWQATETLAAVGAYRLKDFALTYAIRSAQDIETGTIGVGNAQIVKHIANLWADDPLVGYHSRSGSVVTPLGADLPALYGRALSLCSGRAPREIVEHRMLQYPAVPREIADVVFDRMSH